jgi:nicotinate-nucleotide pyrophosphorylase (carboxylating)
MKNVLSANTERLLEERGLVVDEVRRVVSLALDEDLAHGPDITTEATVPALHRSRARFVSRQNGRLAGVPVAIAVFEMIGGADTLSVQVRKNDGEDVRAGDVVLTIDGPTRVLLTGERTALNLLGHLSGVATATSQWANALHETATRVRDTRKTIPGLRALQKYAVRCGGGVNHRMSLSDAALVKDNHIVAAGGVREAFGLVRGRASDIAVEIEVDTLEQMQVALDAGADLILLDNMSTNDMRKAVSLAQQHRESTGKEVLLEASGGLTIERAAEVGSTGVHFVSIGALTHSVTVLDIGLDLEDLV